jgi:hypothetical protein
VKALANLSNPHHPTIYLAILPTIVLKTLARVIPKVALAAVLKDKRRTDRIPLPYKMKTASIIAFPSYAFETRVILNYPFEPNSSLKNLLPCPDVNHPIFPS